MSSIFSFSSRTLQKIIHGEMYLNVLKIDRRTILSSSYDFTSETDPLTKAVGDLDMNKLSLSLDRCHERSMPVSSVMIDKLVRAITTKEQLKGSLYYLHRFRHSENCYFLQPWTTYTLAQKCLLLKPSILLDLLNSKTHYGIFPHYVSLNQCLSNFLKQNDTKEALKLACELFLLELLENKSSQCLALHTVAKFFQETTEKGEIIPNIDNQELKRNVGGILHVIGHITHNPGLFLLGQTMLGSIEVEHGIRFIYQEPWAPLDWNDGYFLRGLEYLQAISTPISHQIIDVFLSALKGNEDLENKAKNVINDLQKQNLISDDESLSLSHISKSMTEKLSSHEKEDSDKFKVEIQSWVDDCQLWYECCSDITADYKAARERRTKEDSLEETAHAMAVAKLGYWDMSKTRTKHSDGEKAFYLREDYVDGSMNDLDILERFRAARDTKIDAYITI